MTTKPAPEKRKTGNKRPRSGDKDEEPTSSLPDADPSEQSRKRQHTDGHKAKLPERISYIKGGVKLWGKHYRTAFGATPTPISPVDSHFPSTNTRHPLTDTHRPSINQATTSTIAVSAPRNVRFSAASPRLSRGASYRPELAASTTSSSHSARQPGYSSPTLLPSSGVTPLVQRPATGFGKEDLRYFDVYPTSDMQAPTLYYVHDPASDMLPHPARSHTYSTYPPPPSVFLGGDVITSLYMSRIRNASPDDSSVSTSTPSPAASTLSFAPSPLDETTPSYATPFNNVPSAHEAVPYIFHDSEQLCGPAHHRMSPTAVLHCDVLEMGSLTGNSNGLVAPAPYVQGGDNAAMPPWLAPYTLPTLSTETGTARNPHLATVPSMYSTRSSLVPDVFREHAEQWPFVDVVPPNMGSDMFMQSASNTVLDEGYWAVPSATVTRTHIPIITHASGLEHQYEPDLRLTIPSDVTPRGFIFSQSSDFWGVATEVSYPESLSPRMNSDTSSRTMERLLSAVPLTHLTEAMYDHRDVLGDFELPLTDSAQVANGARVDDGCTTESLGIFDDLAQYSPW